MGAFQTSVLFVFVLLNCSFEVFETTSGSMFIALEVRNHATLMINNAPSTISRKDKTM